MAAHNEDRERKRAEGGKCNRSYCYMHIYHKAIMTSFVSASKHKGREREGEGAVAGRERQRSSIIKQWITKSFRTATHTHWSLSLSLSLTILCVFISGMLLFTATPCCSVLLARPDPHSDSSSVAGSPSASPSLSGPRSSPLHHRRTEDTHARLRCELPSSSLLFVVNHSGREQQQQAGRQVQGRRRQQQSV